MRLRMALYSAAVLLTSVTGSVGTEHQEHQSDGHFVLRGGTALILNDTPFRFVGSNLYNAAGDPSIYECGPWLGDPDAELDGWFTHARVDYGASVVRFWAFQSYTRGGTNWEALDRVLRLAAQHGLKVIPVLENQWPECTQGGYKHAGWYAGGYRKPYGAYPLSYLDYVGRVVQRYRDDPAILGWSLMNEAESRSADGAADPEALYAFTRDVSAYLKSLDPNHLVTLGVIGGGQPGVEPPAYERLHALNTIDFAEYHDYLADEEPLPGATVFDGAGATSAPAENDGNVGWLSDLAAGRIDLSWAPGNATGSLALALRTAAALDKPLVVGEAGMTTCYRVNGSALLTPASRAALFDAKLATFFAAGGAGYLIWAWHPADDCSFNFAPGDPLNGVLARHAATLAGGP
jgi:mannan endo-1,4-beta-mannosidase